MFQIGVVHAAFSRNCLLVELAFEWRVETRVLFASIAMDRIFTTLPRDGGDLELRITPSAMANGAEPQVEFLNRDLKWVEVPDAWARQILAELNRDFPETFAQILAGDDSKRRAA